MLGRPQEGIAFPAMLLALASLSTAPEQTSAESPETPTVMHDGDAAFVEGAAEAGAVPEAEPPPLLGPVVGEGVSGAPTGAGSESIASLGPLAVRDAHPTSVVTLDPVAAPEGAEESAPDSARDIGEPAGVERPEGELVLWTMVDTVTLDAQSLRNLRSDFVTRLGRVAERMWNEHGLRIEVVEGYRSPDRQQRLFAQGRTVDGPVVTWTRNSLHTAGAAADLHVDGAPMRPEQAVLLSRIAREEGLRTLHPFDSGHIQLDGVARGEGPEARLRRDAPATPVGPTPRVGVAPVAPAARPARPARPGGLVMRRKPARGESAGTLAGSTESSRQADSTPGASGSGPRGSAVRLQAAGRAGSGAHPVASAGPPIEGDAEAIEARPREVRTLEVGSGKERTARAIGPAASSVAPDAAVTPGAGRPEGAPSAGASSAAPQMPTLEASSYLARLEGRHGPVYRRLHLPIDGLDGAASLLLGVRAGAVDASLTLSDPVLAEDLRQNLHELRRTLATRGIETGGLAIRVVPDSGGAADLRGADQGLADSRQADARESESEHGERRGDPSGTRRRGEGAESGRRHGQASHAPHDDPTTSERRDGDNPNTEQEEEHAHG